jgi:hypothetical protein
MKGRSDDGEIREGSKKQWSVVRGQFPVRGGQFRAVDKAVIIVRSPTPDHCPLSYCRPSQTMVTPKISSSKR